MKVFTSVVSIKTSKCKDHNGYFLRVSIIKDKEMFGIEIKLPITRLKKTSECFLQWRDKLYGGAWGLNFVSEKDVKKFLRLCQVPKEDSSATVKPASASNDLQSSTESLQSLKYSQRTGSSSSLNSINTPIIKISSDYLSDSGIENDSKPKIRKPLIPVRPKRLGSLNDSGNNESSFKYKAEQTPVGYDPVEYEFLMKNKLDENGNHEELELSVGLSASREGSNGNLNLLNTNNSIGEDSISGVSEDFHDNRPPSVINITRQMMSTRKAAWLLVKNILLHSRKGKLELASHRKWKNYWVALKGVELIFYHANEKIVTSEDLDEASYQLDIDGCIAQPVPEYAQLENVFSLSTKHGNAYYLQATSPAEVDNWIHCIHSSAATSLVCRKGNANMADVLRKEIQILNENLLSDEKLRKMAALQLKVEKEWQARQIIMEQITSFEHSLEVRHSNMFRLRCYLSAINGTHCPNPQELLAHVSRSTKHALAKIGIFSVTSFHSYVNARNAILPPPEEKPKSKLKIKSKGLKARLMHSLKIADDSVVSAIRSRHTPQLRRKGTASADGSDVDSNASSRSSKSNFSKTENKGHVGSTLYIQTSNNKTTSIPYEENLKILDLMERVCMKNNLDSTDYFIMLMIDDNNHHGLLDYTIPKEKANLDQFQYSSLKLCPKLIYDITLNTSTEYDGVMFGLEVQKASDDRIIITDVNDGSPARKLGVMVDDEIIEINEQNLRNMKNSLEDILEVLNTSCSVTMKLRSKRIDDPKKTFQATESMINFLVCPPPPKSMQTEMTDEILNALIVPAPTDFDESNKSFVSTSGISYDRHSKGEMKAEDIDQFLQQTEAVNMMTREMNAVVMQHSPLPSRMKPGVKLRKSIIELIETEKSYVKNLKVLLERYLIPLKEEDFLSKDEAELLVTNVREIYEFQIKFFEKLKSIVRNESNFDGITEINELQNVVYLIGETFLEYVEKFKLYSTFCSCHSRAVKLLELNTNEALKAFLLARNPKQQHTGTLESYLITPIQRILRYPLLMKTMLKYMVVESEEFKCLNDALISVEHVANYINEMQRISETYTPMFQQMCAHYRDIEKSDIVVDNLLHYGRVQWLQNIENNILRNSDARALLQNQEGENLLIFIFKKAVVLLSANEKLPKKMPSPNSSFNSSRTSNNENKLQVVIPISQLLLRDHAWSDNDTDQIWEIVDTTNGDEETTFMFLNRTGEEKKVFVNAIKQSKKINKMSNSFPVLGQNRSSGGRSSRRRSSNNTLTTQDPEQKKSNRASKSNSILGTAGLPSPLPFRKIGQRLRGKSK